MSGRDLLYKPNVPAVLPDEGSGNNKADKLGVKGQRGREIGSVGVEQTKPASTQVQPTNEVAPAAKPKAFEAAYFNKDVSGVRQVNLRAKPAEALRGGQTATDLKKVVLPPPLGPETPDPKSLNGASELMGIDGSFELSLGSLLGRHGAWAKGHGVTVELIKSRMHQLEEMVKTRQLALKRLFAKKGRPVSATVDQAQKANGQALKQTHDVAGDGTKLAKSVSGQAAGMHRRLAKALGKKIKEP